MAALHTLWLSRARPGRLPARSDFTPFTLKPWLPHIWLLDVVRTEGRLKFRYRLAGTKVVSMRQDDDPTGRHFDEASPGRQNPDPSLARLTWVVEHRQPSWRRGKPTSRMVSELRVVESLFLPLASNGATVDMLLCCTYYYGLHGEEL